MLLDGLYGGPTSGRNILSFLAATRSRIQLVLSSPSIMNSGKAGVAQSFGHLDEASNELVSLSLLAGSPSPTEEMLTTRLRPDGLDAAPVRVACIDGAVVRIGQLARRNAGG